MNISVLSDLQGAMQHEFAWRKKELTALKGLVVDNENKPRQDLHIRAAVTLLYAHWEGFIRQIGRYYLEFVGRRKLKHSDLASHFLAMAVSRLVHGATKSSKIQPCLDLVDFFRTGLPSRSRLAWESGINTKSNLKSDVLREIVLLLGLDYSTFATKEKLLDEKLLNNLNQIAHGQHCMVGYGEYLDLHAAVLEMMQDFYNQVENAALLGSYRVTRQ